MLSSMWQSDKRYDKWHMHAHCFFLPQSHGTGQLQEIQSLAVRKQQKIKSQLNSYAKYSVVDAAVAAGVVVAVVGVVVADVIVWHTYAPLPSRAEKGASRLLSSLVQCIVQFSLNLAQNMQLQTNFFRVKKFGNTRLLLLLSHNEQP